MPCPISAYARTPPYSKKKGKKQILGKISYCKNAKIEEAAIRRGNKKSRNLGVIVVSEW
jgi:hypothetical protein